MTSHSLHLMGVSHFVVVEEAEEELYRANLDASATVLVLPRRYLDEYDTCDEYGDAKSRGPGAARNFAWEHSISAGHPWHWVMDDNINGFFRINHNRKVPAADGTIFRCMEDFVERYRNVAMAGPQYFMFVSRKAALPPFELNTRIYSCNLIRNDLPYRWRGRYNEDTDLSLRMLKDGWVTVLFVAFVQRKTPTQRLRGGNTEAFYAVEGTLPKSKMLVQLHPDVARLVWRFGRVHHHVDYRPFKRNVLVRRPGVAVPDGVDDYGMVFQRRDGDEWQTAEAS